MPEISGVFRDPFNEQVAFFRGKLGNLEPTESWTEKQKEQHDRAFVVAGATKAELLTDLAAAVDKAIAQGTSIEEFRKDFQNAVNRHHWNYRGEFNWRTRVIYNTNLRTSYAAGRLVQLQEFSYWTYKHSGSENYRPQHRSWHNLTLPKEHAFWRTHYPPNGWGCGCRVVGTRSPEDARRIGGEMRPAPNDGINPRTGTPNGIDKGWDYMPGATVKEAVKAAAEKLPRLPAEIGAALADSLTDSHIKAISQEFKEFLDASIIGHNSGKSMVVGGLSTSLVRKLEQHQVKPETAEIIVRDRDFGHSFRSTKANQLSRDWYESLPERLRQSRAILLDKSHSTPALIYVFDVDGSSGKKLVLQLDYKVKKLGTANILNTGKVVGIKGIRAQIGKAYTILDGEL